MPFRLSKQARSYFSEIEKGSTTGDFDTLWDKYYLSAMAGILERRRVPEDEEPDSEQVFMEEVIEPYQDQKYDIYSALIVAEIERGNIPWDKKSEIRELMLELLDSTSHTQLSDYGAQVLNCYAESGFRLIEDEIPQSFDLDEFLEAYHSLVQDLED